VIGNLKNGLNTSFKEVIVLIKFRLLGLCREIKVQIQGDKIKIQKVINGKTEDIKYNSYDSTMDEIKNLERVLNSYSGMLIKDLKQE
jgi:hypothetical protein